MALEGILTIVDAQVKMAKSNLELEAAKDEARYRRVLVDGMIDDEAFNRLNKRFERLLAAKRAMLEANLPWTQQSELEEAAKAVAAAASPAKGSTTK